MSQKPRLLLWLLYSHGLPRANNKYKKLKHTIFSKISYTQTLLTFPIFKKKKPGHSNLYSAYVIMIRAGSN
jgi:hypothetical protein